LQYMDTTVSPQQDFYMFVNGKWMAETSIPSDRSSWGSFNLLRKNTHQDVLALLNSAKKNNSFAAGSDQAKAVSLYASELDTAARNKAGLAPLKPAMTAIAEAKNLKDLQAVFAEYPVQVSNPFFGIYASAGLDDSSMNVAYLSPGSLGLPNRGYYLKEGEKSEKIRQQYVDHITRMFGYWGLEEAEAKKKAETILALETKLATPRLTKEEHRDARKLNNPRSRAQVEAMTPAIDWKAWIANFPVEKEVDTMIVTQTKYMKSLQDILTNTSFEELKTLVSWAT